MGDTKQNAASAKKAAMAGRKKTTTTNLAARLRKKGGKGNTAHTVMGRTTPVEKGACENPKLVPVPETPNSASAPTPSDQVSPSKTSRDSAEEVVVDEKDVCVLCKLPMADGKPGSFGKRSRQLVHYVCVGTYKSVNKKQKKDTVFQAYWEAKSQEEQTSYYRERKRGHDPSKKTNYKVFKANMKEKHRTGTNKGELHRFYPYAEHVEKCEKKGMFDPAAQLAAWRRLLVDPNVKTIKWKGQTMIHRFKGVNLTTFEIDEHESSVNAHKDLQSKEDADDFMALASAGHAKKAERIDSGFSDMRPQGPHETEMPDNCIAGMVDISNVSGMNRGDLLEELDLLIEIEEESDNFQRQMEQTEQMEISVFIAGNAALVEKMEKQEFERHRDRTIMAGELRFQQAVVGVSAAGEEAKTEMEEVVASATAQFGKNDWENYQTLKDQVAKVAVDAGKIATVCEEFKTFCTEQGANLKGATTPAAIKKSFENLVHEKKLATKKIGDMRRFVSSIKSVMKKKELELAKQVSVLNIHDDGDSKGAAPRILPVDVDTNLVVEKGNIMNTVESFDDARAQCKAFGRVAQADDPVITNIASYAGLSKWLPKQYKADEDHVYAVLDKPQYANAVKARITTILHMDESKVFARLTSAVNDDWLAPIFHPAMMMTKKGHNSNGFVTMGMGQMIYCVQGSHMVIGVQAAAMPCYSYAEKLQHSSQLTLAEFTKLLEKPPTFYMKMHAGDFVYIPPGILARQASLTDCTLIKWSTCTDDVQELKQVLSCGTLYAASYPSLATGVFQKWLAYVQERIAVLSLPPAA